jgi:hypothetical protein
MEAKPATSNAPGMGGTDGKEGLPLTGKRSSAAGPQNAQAGVHKEGDAQEDWASLATSDPAFWLKGVDH